MMQGSMGVRGIWVTQARLEAGFYWGARYMGHTGKA